MLRQASKQASPSPITNRVHSGNGLPHTVFCLLICPKGVAAWDVEQMPPAGSLLEGLSLAGGDVTGSRAAREVLRDPFWATCMQHGDDDMSPL